MAGRAARFLWNLIARARQPGVMRTGEDVIRHPAVDWARRTSMPHDWTTNEDIAVLALTKKYGKKGWGGDPLAKLLIARNGISEGSLGMAIQNFLHLLGLPGGLANHSGRQKESFEVFGQRSTEELRKLANERLGA